MTSHAKFKLRISYPKLKMALVNLPPYKQGTYNASFIPLLAPI